MQQLYWAAAKVYEEPAEAGGSLSPRPAWARDPVSTLPHPTPRAAEKRKGGASVLDHGAREEAEPAPGWPAELCLRNMALCALWNEDLEVVGRW